MLEAASTKELALLAASAGVLKIVAKRDWRLETVGFDGGAPVRATMNNLRTTLIRVLCPPHIDRHEAEREPSGFTC